MTVTWNVTPATCFRCGRMAGAMRLHMGTYEGERVAVHPECRKVFAKTLWHYRNCPLPPEFVQETFTVTGDAKHEGDFSEVFLIAPIKEALPRLLHTVNGLGVDDHLRSEIYRTGFAVNDHDEKVRAEEDALDVYAHRVRQGTHTDPVLIVVYDRARDEEPIVSRIIDGNHRVLAAILHGQETIPAVFISMRSLEQELGGVAYLRGEEALVHAMREHKRLEAIHSERVRLKKQPQQA